MNMAKKTTAQKPKTGADNYFMTGAAIAVVFSAIGYTGTDIWLASTQWLLVAAVMALFGVYFKLK